MTVAQSVEKEVPVQLKAIGNIEAYASVAIKSQVSGQIMEIHFDEGSDVEKGALLISIDPAPFLATLHQYEAALAKNRAQEKFARSKRPAMRDYFKRESLRRTRSICFEPPPKRFPLPLPRILRP